MDDEIRRPMVNLYPHTIKLLQEIEISFDPKEKIE